MNSSQMEMLSVKSAVERTLNGYAVAHLDDKGVTPQQRVTNFFNDAERYVAMLFVSGQIDNNYLVRSTHQGIEVKFTTRGQYSCVNYLLPEELRWTVRKMIPRKTEYETIAYKEAYVDDTKGELEHFNEYDPADFLDDVRVTKGVARYETRVAQVGNAHPFGNQDFDYLEHERKHSGSVDPRDCVTEAEEDEMKTVLLNDTNWSVLPDEVGNIKS